MTTRAHIYFIHPLAGTGVSGGHIYNQQLIDHWRQMACHVESIPVSGDLPLSVSVDPDPFASIRNHSDDPSVVLIDSLVLPALTTQIMEFRMRHMPIAALLHLPSFLNPMLATNPAKQQIEQQERQALPMCDLFIVPSAFLGDHVRRAFDLDPERIHVIPPGTPQIAAKTTYAHVPTRWLYVGNVIPGKGLDILLEALHDLTDLNWHLDVFGDLRVDPSWAKRMQDLVEKGPLAERVTFCGVVAHDRFIRRYADYDLLIAPSEFETYGMVIAEAIRARLPFVASKTGAFSDFTKSNLGLFVDSGRSDQLAITLKHLLSDPYVYNRLHLDAIAIDLPSWTVCATRFLDALLRA